MVTIGDFRKKYGDNLLGRDIDYRLKRRVQKIGPSQFEFSRKGIDRHIDISIPHEGMGEAIGLLIDIATFHKMVQLTSEWLRKKNVVLSDVEKTLKDTEEFFWGCYDTFGKHSAAHTSQEDIKKGDYLRSKDVDDTIGVISSLRADAKFSLWKVKFEPLVKVCDFDGCHRTFIATRKDSRYCDQCRNKGNVKNHREKKSKRIAKK